MDRSAVMLTVSTIVDFNIKQTGDVYFVYLFFFVKRHDIGCLLSTSYT
jgi:hypothetical protein